MTLKLWGGESDSGCCSVADVEDARRVAAQLGIPHYVFNFTDDFDDAVVEPYVDEHAAGRTPNPCVECNRSIKFGRLLERRRRARVRRRRHRPPRACDARRPTGPSQLRRGADGAKDQSYVLYMLGQRELAAHAASRSASSPRPTCARTRPALGLRTAAKPESMDVCFITRGGRESFLDRTRCRRAPVRSSTPPARRSAGTTASPRFTVGQRRGLGVATGERRYVVDVDARTATVTIGARGDLLRDAVEVRDLTFVDASRRRPAR